MYSEKFEIFIKMWREEFAIAKTIDEKVCEDRDGNPIPWYTYPAIEYISQFDYSEKEIFVKDGSLFVVPKTMKKAEQTVNEIINIAKNVNANIAGDILNQIDMNANKIYGKYYSYYGDNN